MWPCFHYICGSLATPCRSLEDPSPILPPRGAKAVDGGSSWSSCNFYSRRRGSSSISNSLHAMQILVDIAPKENAGEGKSKHLVYARVSVRVYV